MPGTRRCAGALRRCDARRVGEAERFIAQVAAGSVPGGPDARSLAVAALRDTLAIGVSGLRERSAQAVRSVLDEVPNGVATWSGAQRYGVADVALLHGTACHALDWDDYMHPMHGHCSSVLLSALWGLAERDRRSGADLVDAYLVGYQVDWLASLVLAHSHYRQGWHATSTIGVLGAAAAAAHLLGLDADACAAALGIAASSASGLQNNFGTPTKALHAGLAARGGVLAAQLAGAGMTSSESWLTGEHGVLATFGGDVAASDAATVVRVGLAQHGITTSMGLVQKPWTSCGCSHAAVDAVVSLTADLDVDDITGIEVHVDPAVTRTMRETVPSDEFDSRYSVSWVVAVAAADGMAGPAQFTAESIAREPVLALRERVDVVADLDVGDDDRFAARVVVRTLDGERETTVRHASGHPLAPMDERARVDKQRRALALATDDPDAVVAVIATLPDVDEVTEIGEALRHSDPAAGPTPASAQVPASRCTTGVSSSRSDSKQTR